MKKRIIFFGAYGVLGRGVTETLLKKDYDRLYLADYKAEEVDSADERIVNIKSGDLSDEKNVEKVFNAVEPEKGSEYYLFSTVGGFSGGKELYLTEKDDLDKMLKINLKAAFFISKHFIKFSERAVCRAICLTTALAGLHPSGENIAYGASKAALTYLIESLAEESKSRKISVSGIAPHILDTPANRSWGREEDFQNWQKPSEIGELVHFVFNNYHYLSGNIFTLKMRFEK